MKKILLVGLLGLTFFESLQSAQKGLSRFTRNFIQAVGVGARVGGYVHTLGNAAGLTSMELPQSPNSNLMSPVVITPEVVGQNPKIEPFLVVNGVVNMLVTLYGNASSEIEIDKAFLEDFVRKNTEASYDLYKLVLQKDSEVLNPMFLNNKQDGEVVNLLLLFYKNKEKLDNFIVQIQQAKNNQQIKKLIQDMIVTLLPAANESKTTAVNEQTVQEVLTGAVTLDKMIKEAEAGKGENAIVDGGSNVRILSIKQQALSDKRKAQKPLSKDEQDEFLEGVANMFGVDNPVTSINQLVAEVTENREAIEEVKARVEQELQKNPKANIDNVMERVLSDGLPAPVPTSLVNQSLTDGFLEGVRDICVPMAVKLAGSGSNDEIMQKFEQTVLNREAGYTKEERAYMLGYFQNSLWQIKNSLNNPSDESLLKIVEVTKQLSNRNENKFRG